MYIRLIRNNYESGGEFAKIFPRFILKICISWYKRRMCQNVQKARSTPQVIGTSDVYPASDIEDNTPKVRAMTQFQVESLKMVSVIFP